MIGGNNDRHRMLRLHECGGGIIDGNVINDDVSISASKAIKYANNHMEYGAQIIVEESVVSFKENYIEKGARPSIPGTEETVYLPLAESKTIYDNGISICGYRWVPIAENNSDIHNIPVFETFSYQVDHVEVASTTTIDNPSPGWLTGDVINNIGDDTSWTSEIIK